MAAVCSSVPPYSGGAIPKENVVSAADFLLIHGNGISDPNQISDMVRASARSVARRQAWRCASFPSKARCLTPKRSRSELASVHKFVYVLEMADKPSKLK